MQIAPLPTARANFVRRGSHDAFESSKKTECSSRWAAKSTVTHTSIARTNEYIANKVSNHSRSCIVRHIAALGERAQLSVGERVRRGERAAREVGFAQSILPTAVQRLARMQGTGADSRTFAST